MAVNGENIPHIKTHHTRCGAYHLEKSRRESASQRVSLLQQTGLRWLICQTNPGVDTAQDLFVC